MVQRHDKGRGWICLVLSGLLVLMAVLLQGQILVSCQYAGAFQPFGAWYDHVRELGAVPAARKQGVMLGSEEVTLYAVDDLWQSVFHATLYEGRSITRQDIERQTPCIVLSESTARRLFPSGDVLGQQVTAEGLSLEVVGLIRDGNAWGEADDAVAFVPLSLDIAMDTLSFSVPQADMAYSAAIWENSFRSALPGGTFHNLRQSLWTAWLPFYITFLFFLAKGLRRIYRSGQEKAAILFRRSKEDLQTHYFGQVWLSISARGILLLMMIAALLWALWGMLRLCTLPLSAFPEYVPENLVEPSSWQQTVDALLKKAAASRQYLTRESSSMSTVRSLSHTACLLFMLGIHKRK